MDHISIINCPNLYLAVNIKSKSKLFKGEHTNVTIPKTSLGNICDSRDIIG